MRWLPRFIAAIFVVIAMAGPLLARTPDEIRAAKDATTRQLDLQLELPAAEVESNWPWNIRLPGELVLLALLLGLGVIAYQFRDAIPIWRRRGDGPWDGVSAGDGEPGSEAPAGVVVAADELAREGRFVEAMHLLLLQSLTAIRERLDEPFADSLTSREILRGTRLSDAGKTSLREIVMRVEWTYFGKHPAQHGDYEACRAHFDALARSLRGEAVA